MLEHSVPRQNMSGGEDVSSSDHLPRTPPETLRTKQDETIVPTLSIRGYTSSNLISDISMEFQMTIRTKIERLTPRQASILLMVLCVESLSSGLDISRYLAMEFLHQCLVRNGHDLLEEPSEKVRQTLLVAETILVAIRGKWLNLADREQVPSEVLDLIQETNWLPDERTYNSWKSYWRPTRFLEVMIVPLNTLIERTEGSIRYSGYTKGYGNDGSPASPQSTPRSAELDGDFETKPPPDYDLLELEMYQNLLLSIEQSKAQKRTEN